MRKLSAVAVAMILAIALYFTLFWGLDALRILTSPTYGLDDVWHAQFIFVIGSMLGLGPTGLLKLAAIAAGLCLVERKYSRATDDVAPAVSTELAATSRGAPWFSPFR